MKTTNFKSPARLVIKKYNIHYLLTAIECDNETSQRTIAIQTNKSDFTAIKAEIISKIRNYLESLDLTSSFAVEKESY